MATPAQSIALAAGKVPGTSAGTTYRGLVVVAGVAAAVVRVWDNAGAAGGVLLDALDVAANGSGRTDYPGGLRAQNGVFVEVTGAPTAGSVRVA